VIFGSYFSTVKIKVCVTFLRSFRVTESLAVAHLLKCQTGHSEFI